MNALAEKLDFREMTTLFPGYEPEPPPPSGELLFLGKPLSEVAPGVFVAGVPDYEVPSHVLCKLVPGEIAGTWKLEPCHNPGWVRMHGDIGARLGLIGLSETTMRRLIAQGYVEHMRTAPGVIHINLESLTEHLKRTRNDCAKDESFWTRERRKRWREFCDTTSNLEALD